MTSSSTPSASSEDYGEVKEGYFDPDASLGLHIEMDPVAELRSILLRHPDYVPATPMPIPLADAPRPIPLADVCLRDDAPSRKPSSSSSTSSASSSSSCTPSPSSDSEDNLLDAVTSGGSQSWR